MARATSEEGDTPGIAFVAEAERCPVCDGALKVYKRRSRRVITLAAGAFRAIETLKQCAADPGHPVMGSNALSRQVLARQRYGYDLIVHVGCARYLENKQRGEIQAELHRQWGIELSTGSLSYLCDRFLTHLEALHLACVAQLRSALGDAYPLHINATCEHGKGGLLVCMDGWQGWVLVAGRIPSEHEDHLRPLVEKTTRLFGDPIATVRDFGHEKQHLRRRLGRANLGRDLEDQPAQAALAANLRHPEYVRVLCGSLDQLPVAFAELDQQALEQATLLSRNNRDSKLQHRIRALLRSEKTVVSGDHGQQSNRCLTR